MREYTLTQAEDLYEWSRGRYRRGSLILTSSGTLLVSLSVQRVRVRRAVIAGKRHRVGAVRSARARRVRPPPGARRCGSFHLNARGDGLDGIVQALIPMLQQSDTH